MSEESIDADEACLSIYLSLHVSQLDTVSSQVRGAWHVGQKIYNNNKRTTNTPNKGDSDDR